MEPKKGLFLLDLDQCMVSRGSQIANSNEVMKEYDYEALSDCDLERIETDLYPKAKRNVIWLSAIFCGVSFIAPYLPGKYGGRPAIEAIGYPGGFFIFLFIFSCLVYYVYRKAVYSLKADLLEGKKFVFRTRISRKVWKGHEQFQLHLETLPKALSTEKFLYPVSVSNCFHQGEPVVLEYLARSSVLLRIYAEAPL